ncbi:Holliday junction resolvase RecU [Alkalibacillus almallahensis]|uniref:Holliday junction resolvase RecU n=1 Tax=Alkalibacillus almallahensis TaxID=1379154 RepID=UPI001421D2FD|nr:Holliday junction resolvase RecU [Alkalibacillus almallahensis]NIK11033.1 recombination protein U [Alkalibacillus almallahensis]
MQYPKGSRQSSHIKRNRKNTQKHQTKDAYANRGMTLEKDINETNKYYLESGKAVIHKKPTPIQVVDVDYPKRSAAVIKEAYYRRPSTTDFNGLYQGRHIDFEAKETKNKQSLPLSNIHNHQVEHMKRIHDHGGISFLIVRFSNMDETFLLPLSHFLSIWNEQENGGRKSIPYPYIAEHGFVIPFRLQAKVDYLQVIDDVYFTEENNYE